ncbi:MAG: hypothetical protein CMJ81_19805 [Planctomycetaceae bacterium]|nr:hypothetical protein [Planctomycetaceae bacterium]MBP60000.1 hypothetical protein [Planctomycetaceae bacterium]
MSIEGPAPSWSIWYLTGKRALESYRFVDQCDVARWIRTFSFPGDVLPAGHATGYESENRVSSLENGTFGRRNRWAL